MPFFRKSDDLIFSKNRVIFLGSDRSGSQKRPENSLVPLTFAVNIDETGISHRKTAEIKNRIIWFFTIRAVVRTRSDPRRPPRSHTPWPANARQDPRRNPEKSRHRIFGKYWSKSRIEMWKIKCRSLSHKNSLPNANVWRYLFKCEKWCDIIFHINACFMLARRTVSRHFNEGSAVFPESALLKYEHRVKARCCSPAKIPSPHFQQISTVWT